MLPEFELRSPHTLMEALQLLHEAHPQGAPVAGGTNLVPDLRSGRHCPKVLVDISRLEDLRGIRREDGMISAGGCVTIAELLASPLVAETAGALHAAARLFASPLIRNRATLAGNLVDASPAADTAPPLLVLDAQVTLLSLSGCRTAPLADFFTGVRKTVCRPDELVGSVRWPVSEPASETGFGYYKLGLRKADAISVISVAVRLDLGADGRCHQARVALGSVAPVPLRVYAVEALLQGQALTPAILVEAGRLAAEAVSPISDLRASASYRRRMADVLVQRLLKQTADGLMSVKGASLRGEPVPMARE
jgi:carbon-monoxide dehydrogenase medium subunit